MWNVFITPPKLELNRLETVENSYKYKRSIGRIVKGIINVIMTGS